MEDMPQLSEFTNEKGEIDEKYRSARPYASTASNGDNWRAIGANTENGKVSNENKGFEYRCL